MKGIFFYYGQEFLYTHTDTSYVSYYVQREGLLSSKLIPAFFTSQMNYVFQLLCFCI